MIRFSVTFIVFASMFFLPWQFSTALTFVAAFFMPFLPLAVGVFADTLYYTPKTEILPLFTIYGVMLTGVILFVRSRLSSDIIKE